MKTPLISFGVNMWVWTFYTDHTYEVNNHDRNYVNEDGLWSWSYEHNALLVWPKNDNRGVSAHSIATRYYNELMNKLIVE